MPLYPLYALLFADAGLSEAEVSALFAVWSVTAFVAEVPTGALADRWSRRGALVLASLLEAAGFALWTAVPETWSFAAGFVLWGIGGALASGAAEALVYEGLDAAGARDRYARVNGWMGAAMLGAQVPTAFVATGLFALGGYALVGWASVGTCLVTAALATRFPEPPRPPDGDGVAEVVGFARTLWAGVTDVVRSRALRAVVVAAALLGGLDAIEEYWPLMAGTWGVPATAVPVATLAIPLAGAVGAALGGRAGELATRWLLALLVLSGLLLGAAALWARPAALAAVALFYGLYCAVLVVAEARLQDRITGPRRATVTSVAGLGTELASLPVFAVFALGGTGAVALLVLAVVPVVAAGLRRPPR
ncbi:MFS transporter [Geodermatophilus sp. SYSU D00815]